MRILRLPIIAIVFLMAGLAVFHWRSTREETIKSEHNPGQLEETMGAISSNPRAESDKKKNESLGRKEPTEAHGKRRLSAIETNRKKVLNTDRRKQLLLAIRAAKNRRELEHSEARDNGTPETGLSGDYIKEIVAEAIPEVKACYEQSLKETPDLEGKLIINFTISGEPDIAGLVDELEVTDESDEVIASNATMSDCMADTILSLEFDPPKHGGTVEVSYPFAFRPRQD